MTADATTGTRAGSEFSALSYEQARGELVKVVQQLETGGSTLEESLALWERGEELARVCRDWLEGARARLDAVLEAEAGEGTEDAGEEDAGEEDDESKEGVGGAYGEDAKGSEDREDGG